MGFSRFFDGPVYDEATASYRGVIRVRNYRIGD